MSTATTLGGQPTRWLTRDEMYAQGFAAGGPEIDYGMRWGEHRDVRVSFAPHRDRDGGFLYANEASTDRCLLLARHTTTEQVQAAWAEITDRTGSPDGYLAFAALDYQERPLSVPHASALVWHCLDRELAARRDIDRSPDGRGRFDAAQTLIVARSARVSAEDLLLEATRTVAPDGTPVVVRYRILDRPDVIGRLPAVDLAAAAGQTRRLLQLGERHGFTAQATSLTHGHTNVAAGRVPELAFAAFPDRATSRSTGLAV